jgi:hypothetical protein
VHETQKLYFPKDGTSITESARNQPTMMEFTRASGKKKKKKKAPKPNASALRTAVAAPNLGFNFVDRSRARQRP